MSLDQGAVWADTVQMLTAFTPEEFLIDLKPIYTLLELIDDLRLQSVVDHVQFSFFVEVGLREQAALNDRQVFRVAHLIHKVGELKHALRSKGLDHSQPLALLLVVEHVVKVW